MSSCDHFLRGGSSFKYPDYERLRQQDRSTEENTRRWRTWKPEDGGSDSDFSSCHNKPTGHGKRRRCPTQTAIQPRLRVAARFTGPVGPTTVIGVTSSAALQGSGTSPVISR